MENKKLNSYKKDKDKNKKNNSNDTRKNPSSGYAEKNPVNKRDIDDKPKNQRPG